MTTSHINSFSPIDLVKTLIAKEPSVTLGALVSLGIEVEQAVVAAKPVTWQAAVPIVLSVVIRFFVTPAASNPAPVPPAPAPAPPVSPAPPAA